jgi:pimeloyl-ACP methyl ester carboxylesterase
VLLVGHSQGGMQAAQLLVQGSGYDVTNVVTAGSPIAGAGPFPHGSHVLSLENRADFVPALDGAANPVAPEHVTVTFDDGPDDPVGSHDLSHYVDGAAALDASHDPAVRGSVASLRPFFAPAEVTSQLFVMTRDVSRHD